MPETDSDRRAYSLAVVSHSLLSPLPGDPDLLRDQAARVVAWAARSGHGVIQLPAAGWRLAGGDAAARRRFAREDANGLRFALGQIRIAIDAGYRLSALLIAEADEAGPSGRAWRRRLEAAASDTGVALPAVLTLRPTDDVPDATGVPPW